MIIQETNPDQTAETKLKTNTTIKITEMIETAEKEKIGAILTMKGVIEIGIVGMMSEETIENITVNVEIVVHRVLAYKLHQPISQESK